jgi:hypothetical protein
MADETVRGDAIDTITKLRQFKKYVHDRLDAAGVPTHPEGPHSAEGCRVGDRLDIALGALSLLREMDLYEDFGQPIEKDEPTHYNDPTEINAIRERASALLGVVSDKEGDTQ